MFIDRYRLASGVPFPFSSLLLYILLPHVGSQIGYTLLLPSFIAMNSEISHIHVAKLQFKTFSVGRGITSPATSLLVVTKAGSGCCKLPLKDIKEEEEEEVYEVIQEGNASLAAANEISLDVVVASVLSELHFVFLSKEEQGPALKGFLSGEEVFALLPTGFGKHFVKNRSTLQLRKRTIGSLVLCFYPAQLAGKKNLIGPP